MLKHCGKVTQFFATFVIPKKLLKSHPLVENSTNLVTLAATVLHVRVARFFLTQYTTTGKNVPYYQNITKWP
jgi:hypothetical protein